MRKLTLILTITTALLLAGCGNPTMTSEQYGDAWPFAADRVAVGCDAMGLPYVDAGRDGTYGLTGFAVSKGYPPVAHIHIQGKDLGPFIQIALNQCHK